MNEKLKEGNLVKKAAKIEQAKPSHTGETGRIIRVDKEGIMILYPDRTEILDYNQIINNKEDFEIKREALQWKQKPTH